MLFNICYFIMLMPIFKPFIDILELNYELQKTI